MKTDQELKKLANGGHLHTRQEIVEHFPDLPINSVWSNTWLASHSLEQVKSFYHEGRVGQDNFEAYCAIWRNTIPRLSSECIGYEF
jgi:hypothetical protein